MFYHFSEKSPCIPKIRLQFLLHTSFLTLVLRKEVVLVSGASSVGELLALLGLLVVVPPEHGGPAGTHVFGLAAHRRCGTAV